MPFRYIDAKGGKAREISVDFLSKMWYCDVLRKKRGGISGQNILEGEESMSTKAIINEESLKKLSNRQQRESARQSIEEKITPRPNKAATHYKEFRYT